MRPRQINYLRHDLSAKQALAIALECWAESKNLPVILITRPKQALEVVKTIRVAFSKEKHKQGREVHYGFTLSDVFPYTDEGIRGEAVVLRWRLTPLQNIRNLNLIPRTKDFRHGNK